VPDFVDRYSFMMLEYEKFLIDCLLVVASLIVWCPWNSERYQ